MMFAFGDYRTGQGGLSRRAPLALAAAVLLLALSACGSSRGGNIAYNPVDFGAPDAQSAQVLDANYQIAPLDTLKVNVFQVNDLSGDYEVDLTGHIAMPLIGSVRAADLTTAQLQTALETKLGESYLRNPDVTVGITKSAGSNVTVDGSVNSPGIFPVNGRITLIQAVAMARGTSQFANERRVAVFRQIDGQRMAAAFDLVDIRRGEEPDPAIYRGDIIIVDGSETKQAFQDVMRAVPLLSIFSPIGY